MIWILGVPQLRVSTTTHARQLAAHADRPLSSVRAPCQHTLAYHTKGHTTRTSAPDDARNRATPHSPRSHAFDAIRLLCTSTPLMGVPSHMAHPASRLS